MAQSQSRLPEVVDCYETALSVAKDQGAKSLELRAANDLADLWFNQNKQGEAIGLLKPIYESFTEGFSTTDLEKARSLLDRNI